METQKLLGSQDNIVQITVTFEHLLKGHFEEHDAFNVQCSSKLHGGGIIADCSGRPLSSWQKAVEWVWGMFKDEYSNYQLVIIGSNKLKIMSEREQVAYLKSIYGEDY